MRLFFAALSGFVVFGLLAYTPSLRAEDDLVPFAFSKDATDLSLVVEAERYFQETLGEGVSLDISGPAYARYIPLDDAAPKRFLGLYLEDDYGGCFKLGCELVIFERLPGGKTRIVLDSYTVGFSYAPTQKAGNPRDIFLQSYSSKPWEETGAHYNWWRWTGAKYEYVSEFSGKQ